MNIFAKIIIVIVLLAAGFAGLRLVSGGREDVAAVHPIRGPALQAVYATGTVEAGTMLPIAPRVTARLDALLADEGQKVAKDEVLARLEDTDLQQTLEEMHARAELAERNYKRQESLRGTGAVSKQALDEAKAQRDIAVAAVKRTEAEIGYLRLTSPDAGTIIRRDGEVGELITAGEPVFWLSCCTPLRVEAEVDEEDIVLVQPGQKVLISADAFPERIFDGRVQSITPKGDPVARSYRVRIVFDGDTPLMIGMTAEANIIIRTLDNALMVPRAAVKGDAVWVVRDGQVERVQVKTGIQTPKAIEITDGLTVGDVIVSDPGTDLEAGMRVRADLQDWAAE